MEGPFLPGHLKSSHQCLRHDLANEASRGPNLRQGPLPAKSPEGENQFE